MCTPRRVGAHGVLTPCRTPLKDVRRTRKQLHRSVFASVHQILDKAIAGMQQQESAIVTRSSILWISEYVPTLEDLCIVFMLRRPHLILHRLSHSVLNTVRILRERFSAMQRFTSGHRLIMYAGIDCSTDRATSKREEAECIAEIKSGLQAYLMASGDARSYAAVANTTNVYSSLAHYYTLPSRELYNTDKSYRLHVAGIVEEKEECIRTAWDVVCSVGQMQQELKTTVRKLLYLDIPEDADPRLVAILGNVIDPVGCEALMYTVGTYEPLNAQWLEGLDWTTQCATAVIQKVCKAGRVDVLKWLLTTDKVNRSAQLDVMTCATSTSLSLVIDVLYGTVDVSSLQDVAVESLYLGAFRNPDQSCLFYLETCGIRPPESMTITGRISTVAMCTVQSHLQYMRHLTSFYGFQMSPHHFREYLMQADVDCMNEYLKTCGKTIVESYRRQPDLLLFALSDMSGPMDARKNVVEYVISELVKDDPSVYVLEHLLVMCRAIFRKLPSCTDEHPIHSVLDQMRYVSNRHYYLKTLLYSLASSMIFPHHMYDLMHGEDALVYMLPSNKHALGIMKYLVEEEYITLPDYKVGVETCMHCAGLCEYLDTWNNRGDWISISNPLPLFTGIYFRNPGEVVNCLPMIVNGRFPLFHLTRYVHLHTTNCMFDLRNVVAFGVLQRIAKDLEVARVAAKTVSLPPP